VKFSFIQAEKVNFPVTLMCRTLSVSRAGYYAWTRRPPSERAKANNELVERIKAIRSEKGKSCYGSPRVHEALKEKGETVGRNRIALLMRENDIVAQRKKRRTKTTDSNHNLPVAENLLHRNFTADAPNQKWVADVTYIATLSGWLYLAVILDLFSRKVVGWSISNTRDRHLPLAALEMAVANRNPPPGLIHHSDRGSEYASDDFQKALEKHGMVCSMSRKGNCWDNACAESFFGSMKTESSELEILHQPEKTKTIVFEYVEVFYNRQRSHSTIGYRSPVMYEREVANTQQMTAVAA